MDNKKSLIKKLQYQMGLEATTKQFLDEYREALDDDTLVKVFDKFIVDKERHMDVVTDMLVMAYSIDKSQTQAHESLDSSIFHDIFKDADTVLLNTHLREYAYMVLNYVAEQSHKHNMLYLSYNKVPKYAKRILKDHGAKEENMKYVVCSTMESENDINVRPGALPDLASAIQDNCENSIVVVDSISAFMTFHETDEIVQFVAMLNDDARLNPYKIMWVGVKSIWDDITSSRVAHLCDKVRETH